MEGNTAARKKAMDLLLVRDRTEKDLRDRLIRAGFSQEESADALSYVKSFGYVDDARFAEHYIATCRDTRSARRLRYDLARYGVPSELIDAAFESLGEWDETEQIRRLALKKAASLREDDPKRYSKTAAYLAGKGYRSGGIISVLSDIFGA